MFNLLAEIGIDWSLVFKPITDDMGTVIQSALIGVFALISLPVMFKAGVGLAAWIGKQMTRIFG